MMFLLVAIGGAIGSVLRYLTTLLSVQYIGSYFPFGTLFVNVIGSFLIGLCLSLLETHVLVSPYWKPLVTVGILGGFTTFSSFSFDTFGLILQAEYGKAALNILLNLTLGMLAVTAGYMLFKS